MLEIKGKINTAICYANVIEEKAIEQIRRMCDYEFTEGRQENFDLQDSFGFAAPQAIYKWQRGTAMPTIDNFKISRMEQERLRD